MSNPRIIFAGTPEFALASLKALVDASLVPAAVYTQPDRPAGRGRHLTASSVKQFAQANSIAVLQPESLRGETAAAELEALQPDVMIVAAYGLILPQRILDIPKHGCLNVHASVLPRWRGAAPIQAAILADDKATGVTLMGMTAGLDSGPVFSTRTLAVGRDETAGELHDRLAVLGGELLVTDLAGVLSGEKTSVPQDEAAVTYAGKIQKQDAEIDWTLTADELHRHVRAYNPVPGAFFVMNGSTRIKVWRAQQVADINAAPGQFVQYDREAVVVACGRDGLRLDELQLPGKRRVSARDFVAQIDLRR